MKNKLKDRGGRIDELSYPSEIDSQEQEFFNRIDAILRAS